jgi:hypothetical protein
MRGPTLDAVSCQYLQPGLCHEAVLAFLAEPIDGLVACCKGGHGGVPMDDERLTVSLRDVGDEQQWSSLLVSLTHWRTRRTGGSASFRLRHHVGGSAAITAASCRRNRRQ